MFDSLHPFGKRQVPVAKAVPGDEIPVPSLTDVRRHCLNRISFGRIPSGCEFEPGAVGAVPGEWTKLSGMSAGRLILYFHGGCFIAGSPQTHRPLIASLAKVAEARVFAPDYRLAPDFPFPAAVRDGLDVYRQVVTGSGRPDSIVLAGDGAGGGLALSVLLAIRNAGLPMPAALVAMSPWADLSLSGWSMLKNQRADRILSWSELFVCARHYLGAAAPSDVYASPVFASFKDFPPMMIHAGARELLRDDASRISTQANAAGVSASVEVYDGQGHLFQANPHDGPARASLQRLGQFIRSKVPIRDGAGAPATH